MTEDRRAFLKKSLKIGTTIGATTVVASTLMASDNSETQKSNGVIRGKTTKKEVLYFKSELWEKFYKIVY